MTTHDMTAWANTLRDKYGILWPVSLTLDPEDFEEVLEAPQDPTNAIPFN